MEELPEVADRVLAVVDQVPPGHAVTYGDIAAVVGIGPRQVGSALSGYGFLVGWWRVVRADGRPPQGHEQEALERYAREGTPMRHDRVDLSRARIPLRPPEER